jgi:hypothetical protein
MVSRNTLIKDSLGLLEDVDLDITFSNKNICSDVWLIKITESSLALYDLSYS